MPTSLIRVAAAASILSVGAARRAQPPRASNAPSLDRPCSFVTAADMASLLGTPVAGATDEHFRCRYAVGAGWVETKLMDFGLKATRDIYDYDRVHGRPVPGVGDQAYRLGATLVAKLGDVVVVVDGSDAPRPPDDARLKAIALRIVRAIP